MIFRHIVLYIISSCKLPYRQALINTKSVTDWPMDWLTDWLTDWLIDWWMDRLTNGWTVIDLYWPVLSVIDEATNKKSHCSLGLSGKRNSRCRIGRIHTVSAVTSLTLVCLCFHCLLIGERERVCESIGRLASFLRHIKGPVKFNIFGAPPNWVYKWILTRLQNSKWPGRCVLDETENDISTLQYSTTSRNWPKISCPQSFLYFYLLFFPNFPRREERSKIPKVKSYLGRAREDSTWAAKILWK